MKTATENLENDHVQILRLIAVMECITQSTDPQVEHLETVVKVIREFADGLHHAKEEQLFFPLLVQKGFSNESGPVAVMLNEHAEGRNFVKGMAESILQYKHGESGALQAVSINMLGYASLLKAHIGKENNILFQMADKILTGAEQESMLLEFTKVENERGDHHKKEDYVAVIEQLSGIYIK